MTPAAVDYIRGLCELIARGEVTASVAAQWVGRVTSGDGERSQVDVTPSNSTFSSATIFGAWDSENASGIRLTVAPGAVFPLSALRDCFGEYVLVSRDRPGSNYPALFIVRQPGMPFDNRVIAEVDSPGGETAISQGAVVRLTVTQDPKFPPEHLSPLYERVRVSVDEPNDAPQLDLEALLQLDPVERGLAEELLTARLNGSSDARIPDALVAMKATRAGASLRRALTWSPRLVQVHAARALKLLEDSDDGLPFLLAALRDGTAPERVAAAAAAVHFPDEEVVNTLGQAVDDPIASVRQAAYRSVLVFGGLLAWGDSRRGLLGILQEGLASPLVTVRSEALGRMADFLVAVRAGRKGDELGLDHQVSDALEEAVGRLDARAVAQSEGMDREWAERALLARAADDHRVIRLLGDLKVALAIQPLRELLGDPGDEIRRESAQALLALTQDSGIRGEAELVLAGGRRS